MMNYQIHATHYFYAGAISAPPDGPLSDDAGEALTFATREEARAHLAEMGWEKGLDSDAWSPTGRYDLAHGEYSRPTYIIVEGRALRVDPALKEALKPDPGKKS